MKPLLVLSVRASVAVTGPTSSSDNICDKSMPWSRDSPALRSSAENVLRATRFCDLQARSSGCEMVCLVVKHVVSVLFDGDPTHRKNRAPRSASPSSVSRLHAASETTRRCVFVFPCAGGLYVCQFLGMPLDPS
jgi:hypothetical protein